jgi:hypothetical protein
MPAAPPLPDEDAGMRRVYALVIVCHAAVITALWLFGRVFSS